MPLDNSTAIPDSERREYKRISYWLFAKYRQDESPKPTTVRNISLGGLLISSKEPLDPKLPLSIQIYLPTLKGYEKINIEAKVVWQKKDESDWKAGISFLAIEPKIKEILSSFINYLHLLESVEENAVGIPYWCISKITPINNLTQPTDPIIKIAIESKTDLAKGANFVLNLKLPTFTMPFDVKGTIVESKFNEGLHSYLVIMGLTDLDNQHLQALKNLLLI